MNQSALPAPLRRVVLQLCEDVDTAVSLSVSILIRYEQYDELSLKTVRPDDYINVDSYRRDNVVCGLLRKCKDIPVKVDPESEAFQGWLASEKGCCLSNARLESHVHQGPFADTAHMRVNEILLRVKKTFQGLLGPIPGTIAEAKLGKGSTFNDRGKFATIPDKFTSRPTISAKARCLLPFWYETYWARNLCTNHPWQSDPETVDLERLAFVDKTARVKRTISVGPSINTYFQLGIGRHIRWRLLRAGISLDEAEPRHKRTACAASKDDTLVTIDLSSASDSVAFNLVRFLCTELWFEVLNGLRIPIATHGKKDYRLQKFSAMGNGYTFELETTIFLAASIVATELAGEEPRVGVNVLVYGDDIIVSKGASAILIPMLRYLGFNTNVKKTFLSGRFRESCGGDFFDGEPVRAHFLEEYPTKPSDWISLANGLRRACPTFDISPWSFTKRAWNKCLGEIPVGIRELRIPDSYGDLAINCPPWPIPLKGRIDLDMRNYYVEAGVRHVKVWRPIHTPLDWKWWHPGVMLASALYGVPSSGPIPRLNGDYEVSGYRFGYVPFS